MFSLLIVSLGESLRLLCRAVVRVSFYLYGYRNNNCSQTARINKYVLQCNFCTLYNIITNIRRVFTSKHKKVVRYYVAKFPHVSQNARVLERRIMHFCPVDLIAIGLKVLICSYPKNVTQKEMKLQDYFGYDSRNIN